MEGIRSPPFIDRMEPMMFTICFGVFSTELKRLPVASKDEGIAAAISEMKHPSVRSASVVDADGKVIWGGQRDSLEFCYANGWLKRG